MSVPKSFIDELKARLPVSQVVGKRVTLKRTGREYMGLSPFSNEKSPSFTVNDEKGFYHCFSSGKHGDIFSFLMETENLSFAEAIERLASEAGMEVPRMSPQEDAREARLSSLREACAIAARFFQTELGSARGREARDYLKGRALRPDTIEMFGLGFAPDSYNALSEHLVKKGLDANLLLEAGLVAKRDADGKIFDRFRNRVMFPILDARGRVIAFGGRALSPEERAKYFNSPDSPLFHKGHVLYNEARARSAAVGGGQLIVVEGYMDVIALSQAGLGQAVAPLGTALTGEQLVRLWRMAAEPVLCFDGDKAGMGAALRVVERALALLKPGFSLQFALLPEGRDPDDLVRAGGRAAMEAVMAQALPLVDMLWMREHDAMQSDTPEQRAAFETRLENAVRTIGDVKVRSHYAAEIKRRIATLFAPPPALPVARSKDQRSPAPKTASMMGVSRGAGPGAVARANVETRRSAVARGQIDPDQEREASLILLACSHPELLEAQGEVFAHLDFVDPFLDKLRNEIIDLTFHKSGLDKADGKQHFSFRSLDQSLGDIASRISEKTRARTQTWLARAQGPAMVALCWQTLIAMHELSVLEGELVHAETALAEEMTDESFARFQLAKAQVETARQGAERMKATLDAASEPSSDADRRQAEGEGASEAHKI